MDVNQYFRILGRQSTKKIEKTIDVNKLNDILYFYKCSIDFKYN